MKNFVVKLSRVGELRRDEGSESSEEEEEGPPEAPALVQLWSDEQSGLGNLHQQSGPWRLRIQLPDEPLEWGAGTSDAVDPEARTTARPGRDTAAIIDPEEMEAIVDEMTFDLVPARAFEQSSAEELEPEPETQPQTQQFVRARAFEQSSVGEMQPEPEAQPETDETTDWDAPEMQQAMLAALQELEDTGADGSGTVFEDGDGFGFDTVYNDDLEAACLQAEAAEEARAALMGSDPVVRAAIEAAQSENDEPPTSERSMTLDELYEQFQDEEWEESALGEHRGDPLLGCSGAMGEVADSALFNTAHGASIEAAISRHADDQWHSGWDDDAGSLRVQYDEEDSMVCELGRLEAMGDFHPDMGEVCVEEEEQQPSALRYMEHPDEWRFRMLGGENGGMRVPPLDDDDDDAADGCGLRRGGAEGADRAAAPQQAVLSVMNPTAVAEEMEESVEEEEQPSALVHRVEHPDEWRFRMLGGENDGMRVPSLDDEDDELLEDENDMGFETASEGGYDDETWTGFASVVDDKEAESSDSEYSTADEDEAAMTCVPATVATNVTATPSASPLTTARRAQGGTSAHGDTSPLATARRAQGGTSAHGDTSPLTTAYNAQGSTSPLATAHSAQGGTSLLATARSTHGDDSVLTTARSAHSDASPLTTARSAQGGISRSTHGGDSAMGSERVLTPAALARHGSWGQHNGTVKVIGALRPLQRLLPRRLELDTTADFETASEGSASDESTLMDQFETASEDGSEEELLSTPVHGTPERTDWPLMAVRQPLTISRWGDQRATPRRGVRRMARLAAEAAVTEVDGTTHTLPPPVTVETRRRDGGRNPELPLRRTQRAVKQVVRYVPEGAGLRRRK